MRSDLVLYALNRGVISKLGLARMDTKKLSMAAEIQENWMPRVLGSAMLRPGLGHLGAMYLNAAARMLRFIFATNDTALLEMTERILRVWINDALLTRPAVTTAITNGTFPVDLSGWNDLDEAGASSAWQAPNYMALVGTGTAFAIREQQVAPVEVGTEHGIRIKIALGPVLCRIGSASGGEEYLKETSLDTGEHSISIVPTGSFYIRFFSRHARVAYVSNCTIEAAGVVTLPTPYAESDLGNLRTDQSGDVVYIACRGLQQRKVERRGTRPNARSWSVVRYAPEDGPFKVRNVSPTTLAASGLTGNVFLNASAQLFNAQHVGALFSLTSSGQAVTATGAVNGVPTASIRVTGIGTDRTFSILIEGDATASTVDLQRSYDNTTWATIGAPEQWTADVSTTYNDTLDNQIVYYRLLLTTRVAPDSVTMTLRIGSGSVRGIARVTTYVSAVQVAAEVLSDMGGTDATGTWQEGNWSDLNGWPTSVRLHEGRLWWAGQNGICGSISDDYESFDETTEGNSGPINRTIGSGPVDDINWLMSLKGLILGAQGAEHAVRASSLDEPLTPTNFNVKSPSTQGSGAVEAVKIDQAGYFVNRSGVKVFTLAFNVQDYDYGANCLMELAPDIGQPGIVRMDVQRLPDTRVHCVRSDGTVVVAVINKVEEVLAWVPVTSGGAGGIVEDVVVLPAVEGNLDDQVYYVVKRTINGATVRYLEKWAQEIDCLGDQDLCYLADCYATYDGAATTNITGLDHLEGEEVVVWADGADVGTDDSARPWTQRYTVSGGAITLAVAASKVVVGLGYSAPFQSAKLGFAGPGIAPLNRKKKIGKVGFVMANTHPKGIKYGTQLDDNFLDDLPEIEAGTAVGTAVVEQYDQEMIEFPGEWTSDMRVCLQAQAPRPATVLAIAMAVEQS